MFSRRYISCVIRCLVVLAVLTHAAVVPSQAQTTASSPALNETAGVQALARFGTVRAVEQPAGSVIGTVVHIQDVHRNPEAQTNISAALQALARSTPIDLVALEGASIEIDLRSFWNFPAAASVQRVADTLLRSQTITGPVHAGLAAKWSNTRFVGVEDQSLYSTNVRAYQHAARHITELKPELKMAWDRALRDANRQFARTLREFELSRIAYHRGALPINQYIGRLSQLSSPLPPALLTLNTSLALERTIDFHQVQRERKNLLAQLSSRQAQGSELERISDITEFHRQLLNLATANRIDTSAYPMLLRYTRYVSLANQLQVDQINRDLRKVETEIVNRLAVRAGNRQLIQQLDSLCLAEKLLNFTLTKQEWQQWPELRRTSPLDPAQLRWFELFYHTAQQRDRALTEKMLDETKGARLAVLVTGGFHADGIDRALVNAGYRVVRFVPTLMHTDHLSGSSYLSAFARERTPLENLFSAEKLFLSPPPFAVIDQIRAQFATVIDASRKNVSEVRRLQQFFPKLRRWTIEPARLSSGAATFIATTKSRWRRTLQLTVALVYDQQDRLATIDIRPGVVAFPFVLHVVTMIVLPNEVNALTFSFSAAASFLLWLMTTDFPRSFPPLTWASEFGIPSSALSFDERHETLVANASQSDGLDRGRHFGSGDKSDGSNHAHIDASGYDVRFMSEFVSKVSGNSKLIENITPHMRTIATHLRSFLEGESRAFSPYVFRNNHPTLHRMKIADHGRLYFSIQHDDRVITFLDVVPKEESKRYGHVDHDFIDRLQRRSEEPSLSQSEIPPSIQAMITIMRHSEDQPDVNPQEPATQPIPPLIALFHATPDVEVDKFLRQANLNQSVPIEGLIKRIWQILAPRFNGVAHPNFRTVGMLYALAANRLPHLAVEIERWIYAWSIDAHLDRTDTLSLYSDFVNGAQLGGRQKIIARRLLLYLPGSLKRNSYVRKPPEMIPVDHIPSVALTVARHDDRPKPEETTVITRKAIAVWLAAFNNDQRKQIIAAAVRRNPQLVAAELSQIYAAITVETTPPWSDDVLEWVRAATSPTVFNRSARDRMVRLAILAENRYERRLQSVPRAINESNPTAEDSHRFEVLRRSIEGAFMTKSFSALKRLLNNKGVNFAEFASAYMILKQQRLLEQPGIFFWPMFLDEYKQVSLSLELLNRSSGKMRRKAQSVLDPYTQESTVAGIQIGIYTEFLFTFKKIEAIAGKKVMARVFAEFQELLDARAERNDRTPWTHVITDVAEKAVKILGAKPGPGLRASNLEPGAGADLSLGVGQAFESEASEPAPIPRTIAPANQANQTRLIFSET